MQHTGRGSPRRSFFAQCPGLALLTATAANCLPMGKLSCIPRARCTPVSLKQGMLLTVRGCLRAAAAAYLYYGLPVTSEDDMMKSARPLRACATRRLLQVAMFIPAIALAGDQAAFAQPAAGAEWRTPAGTVQGTRFSSLTQINTRNVNRLKEDFKFSTDI